MGSIEPINYKMWKLRKDVPYYGKYQFFGLVCSLLAFLQENLFKPAKAICNFFGKRNETN
jgi:hypothetical protein